MEATLTLNANNKAKAPLEEAAKGLKKVDDKAKEASKSLASRLGAAAKKAMRDMADLAKKAGEVGKAFKEVAGKAAELAAKLLASAAAIGYGFKTLFVDIAAEAESCGQLLSGSLGKEMGEKALKDVRDFASSTGRELRDVTSAFLAMNRGGVKPTEESLKALADMASAHGKSMTEMAQSFENTLKGQVGSLEEFGVKSEQVGERLLFTYTNQQGELVRLAAKANDPENLNKILNRISQEKTGGADEERGKSFSGMVAKLMSAWTEFRTLVMDSGPFAYLKEQLGQVLAWVQKLRDNGSLDRLAKEWGGKLTDALKKVKAGVMAGYKAFKRWLPTIQSVYQKLGGFKTIVAAVATYLGGPLVGSLATAGKAVAVFGKAMLTTPVGWIALAVAGLAALLDHFGALDPLIEGFKEGFSAMSDILGTAFKGVLESLNGLFADMGLGLTDVNGQLNPEGWKQLGEAIGIFTGGALADLLGALGKTIGFLHDLGAGIGTVVGALGYGDINEQQSRNMDRGARLEKIQAARARGDHESANRLVQEHLAAEQGYKHEDAGNGPTVGPGRAPVAAATQRQFALNQQRGATTPTQPAVQSPGQAVAQAAKPVEVKTEVKSSVDVKLSGSLPPGFTAQASSTAPNTTVSDKTKQNMGYGGFRH